MTPIDFKAELKKGLRPGYLFCGEEEYLKRYYLRVACRNVIPDPALDTFNRVIINGDNYSPQRLEEALSALPVMSDRKLVLLEEINISEMKDADFSQLCEILSHTEKYEYNILILYAREPELDIGELPKRPSKQYKALCGFLTPVNFDHETPAKLVKWIKQHFAASGIQANDSVCTQLINTAGRDMFNLSCEIEKLTAYVKATGRAEVTADDIKLNCSQIKEIGAFDFANSILNGDVENAFSILGVQKTMKVPPEMILSGISRVYSDMSVISALSSSGISQYEIVSRTKIHEYKVGMYLKTIRRVSRSQLSDIIGLCADADVKIKSTALDSYMLLERLIIMISDILKP